MELYAIYISRSNFFYLFFLFHHTQRYQRIIQTLWRSERLASGENIPTPRLWRWRTQTNEPFFVFHLAHRHKIRFFFFFHHAQRRQSAAQTWWCSKRLVSVGAAAAAASEVGCTTIWTSPLTAGCAWSSSDQMAQVFSKEPYNSS